MWRAHISLEIREAAPLRVALTARPPMQAGMSALRLEAGTDSGAGRTLEITIWPLAVGSVRNAYAWDGGAGHYALADASLIDLRKRIGADGSIVAWEAKASLPGTLRLKVWRDGGDHWELAGQSELFSARAGSNRFVLRRPLVVRRGDYLGLYTSGGLMVAGASPLARISELHDQHSINLLLSADLGAQYGLAGDSPGGPKAEARPVPNPSFAYRVEFAGPASGAEPVLRTTLSLRPGRHTYPVPIAPDFAADTDAEIQIRSVGGEVRLYPSLAGYLQHHPEVVVERGDGGPPPLISLLLAMLTGLGVRPAFFRSRRRWDLAWFLLPLAVTILSQHGFPAVADSAGMVAAASALLVLPGFIILELAFPGVACELDGLERAPLLFGLSVAAWVAVAPFAYRLGWATDATVDGALAIDLLGAAAVLARRPIAAPSASQKVAFSAWFLVLVAAIAVAAAYAAQFQMPDYDVPFHIAGFRNIADGPRIVSSDNTIGPAAPALPQYIDSVWYLVGGLTARLAHADCARLYVFLTLILVPLVPLVAYALLHTLLGHRRLAMAGVALGIGPWIYASAVFWRIFWSLYVTFLPFAGEIAEMILLPLAAWSALHYVAAPRRDWAVLTVLMAIAMIGIHVEYVVHGPYLLAAMLVGSTLSRDSRRHWRRTGLLIGAIFLVSGLLAWLSLTAPGRPPVAPAALSDMIGMWKGKGLWFRNANFYAGDPWEYFAKTGWKVSLALAGVVLFMVRRGASRGLIWTVVAGVAAPWILVFNPLLVPLLVRLLHSTVPFYRMLGSAGMLAKVVEFGGAGCLVAWTLDRWVKRRAPRDGMLAALALLAWGLPLGWPSVRAAVAGAFGNYGWYPSLLDLPYDPFYRALNRLEPGPIAVRSERAILTAALTSLDPIFVAGDRIGDYRIADERDDANRKIVGCRGTPAEIIALMRRYHCRYVMVSVSSPALARFRQQPGLFAPVVEGESDVVFAPKF